MSKPSKKISCKLPDAELKPLYRGITSWDDISRSFVTVRAPTTPAIASPAGSNPELTDQGVHEAHSVAEQLRSDGLTFDIAF
ncbi:hypothetical protein, partial [Rhodanobacter lindaniclasticus]